MRCAAEREEKKAAKAALKAAREKTPRKRTVKAAAASDEWVPIDGLWFAQATDGRGHRGGDGKYRVPVPVKDFGAHFILGGSARFTKIPGGEPTIFKLPETVQLLGTALVFDLQVHPESAGGRMIAVGGLEVKRAAA